MVSIILVIPAFPLFNATLLASPNTLDRYYSSLWYYAPLKRVCDAIIDFSEGVPSFYCSVCTIQFCNVKAGKMSQCQSRHPLSTALIFLLFLLDVASDVATGIELYLNDHYVYGWAVLGLVLLPSAASILAEFMRSCVYGGCCGEANTHWIPLIFYHPYTAFM